MSGILYGIGVGPGDPELMTLKAVRLIAESDVIVVPGKEVKKSVAYEIAKGAYPQIDQKNLVCIDMPMTKDKKILQESHQNGINTLCEFLKEGKKVSFLTLGDPSIYSTYMYLQKGVQKAGFEVCMISGVPSFCAVAAALKTSLTEKEGMLHIIPATYGVKDSLSYSGTKIYMKAGKKLNKLKEALRKEQQQVMMIENCGMTDEKIYKDINDLPDEAGYYSLVIVKEEA